MFAGPSLVPLVLVAVLAMVRSAGAAVPAPLNRMTHALSAVHSYHVLTTARSTLPGLTLVVSTDTVVVRHGGQVQIYAVETVRARSDHPDRDGYHGGADVRTSQSAGSVRLPRDAHGWQSGRAARSAQPIAAGTRRGRALDGGRPVGRARAVVPHLPCRRPRRAIGVARHVVDLPRHDAARRDDGHDIIRDSGAYLIFDHRGYRCLARLEPAHPRYSLRLGASLMG